MQNENGIGRRELSRFGKWSVVVPAAGVTFALCLFMGRLIQAEFIEPPAKEVRELASITPSMTSSDPIRRPHTKPVRMDDALPPPPPPDLSATKRDVDLPTPIIEGKAPTEIDFDRLDEIVVDPVVIDSREAKPISPPVPQFPRAMAERGVEGACEVRFNVSTRGEPVDISADCSHSGFARAAERAVAQVRFAPMIVRGQAVERRNVIYPIEFTLEG
ncbi:MAG: energy transducer TonB [Pseudomonadota bacterium]